MQRRVVLGLLVAVALVLAGLAAAVVHEDRQQCPPGPWAHPVKRLTRQPYDFACARLDQLGDQ